MKTAVRIRKITTIAQLRGQTIHAQREDETARNRLRPGAEAGAGYAWSKAGEDGPEARDYVAALKAHKVETGAGERKGAPLALQMLVVVSPEWIRETGGLHDEGNARNKAIYEAAREWAESWAGKGAVIASRLDLDEVGGGVVDLMVSPVRAEARKNAPRISTSKAIKELQAATGERNEYAAAQTSWAAWAQDHLDGRLERGERKEVTRREHVSPEVYGELAEKAKASVRDREQAVAARESVADELVKAADRNRMDALRERQKAQKEAEERAKAVTEEVKKAQEKIDATYEKFLASANAFQKEAEEERKAAAQDRAEAAKEKKEAKSFREDLINKFNKKAITWEKLDAVNKFLQAVLRKIGPQEFKSLVADQQQAQALRLIISSDVSMMAAEERKEREAKAAKEAEAQRNNDRGFER